MHEEKPSARIEIESRKEKGGRNFFSDRTRGAPTESMGQEGSRGQILHPVIEVMMHWILAIRVEEEDKGKGKKMELLRRPQNGLLSLIVLGSIDRVG